VPRYGILLAVLLTACTRAQPSIEFGTMRLVWQQVDSVLTPTLIFFVMASDPDGAEDLEELRLYHDDDGLLWRFTSDNWQRLEESGKTWIGSKMLRMPQGESFPSGQYRAVVIDKAGEQGEKTFGFEMPADSKYRFPRLSVAEGNYSVTSDYPENYLLCYHSDGAFRSLLKLDSKNGTILSLRLSADVSSIALWADDQTNVLSALTAQVNVR
jgi:hypothetical protein